MTRNVKRFLAVSLLSLAPSVAAAEQFDFGGLEFFRGEYVTAVKTETFELKARHAEGGASLLANPLQTFAVGNWTGVNVSFGGTLSGVRLPIPPPNPLGPVAKPSVNGVFQIEVAPATSVTQTYFYTTNPADPTGAAKTCLWQLAVTYNAGTATCSATIGQAAYGTQGVICYLDNAQSWINPTTCDAQVVSAME
ncbi:hypothetical protein LXT21_41395 [Myxococcus sp. K38C18041901]|uniref:hypothetical protein n=1 Tax=Myxococcus guangdongensis TaxID=2906760 RepID=UPI0020A7DE05|nr:hypothetical protein [Myxococcus guangdongensis]MCP3065248.1 hypothetical protein [Myxococcus guangdongensis]